jgi:MOSC domain-containing protein YiiM
MTPRTDDELAAGLDEVRAAPADDGVVRMIVRRPAVDARETLLEGELDADLGLVGDTWAERASRGTPADERYAQVTLMNARYTELIAGDRARWPLAGDQLYVDLDLSIENLPPGSHLAIGDAVLRISEEPHTGCAKFSARYGSPAWRLANSELGRALRLRGANASVVTSGTVREGDPVSKV